ncbi:MAG: cytochrome c oxidase subunit 4 [Arenicella sp.]|jgi:cytochrome c oxidase subunit 4
MVRDDIIEYSLDGHHSEEAGKKIRTKIWKVTALLSAVTIVEVAIGWFLPRAEVGGIGSWSWFGIETIYMVLTIFKAAYIILVFMHLGEERKALRRMILWPYILFILYLIFILFNEAYAIGANWTGAY